MEEAPFLTLMKKKEMLKKRVVQASILSFNSTWEEKAFADDRSGSIGACIWPPRSYSCSFCGREFRSAQALGGHMNVHRRDRARLQQPSLSSHDERLHENGSKCSLGTRNFSHFGSIFKSNLSTAKVFALSSSYENLGDRSRISPIIESQQRGSPSECNSKPRSSAFLSFLDTKPEAESNTKAENFPFLGMNCNVNRNRSSTGSCGSEAIRSKRCKTTASVEDLDLELRLGDSQKVN